MTHDVHRRGHSRPATRRRSLPRGPDFPSRRRPVVGGSRVHCWRPAKHADTLPELCQGPRPFNPRQVSHVHDVRATSWDSPNRPRDDVQTTRGGGGGGWQRQRDTSHIGDKWHSGRQRCGMQPRRQPSWFWRQSSRQGPTATWAWGQSPDAEAFSYRDVGRPQTSGLQGNNFPTTVTLQRHNTGVFTTTAGQSQKYTSGDGRGWTSQRRRR